MEIKTKFNVGDKVFLLHNSEIKHMEIYSIDLYVNNGNSVHIRYNLNFKNKLIPYGEDKSCLFEAYRVPEVYLYSTKLKLIKSL